MQLMQIINRKVVLTYATMVLITLVALFLVKEFNIAYPIRVTSSSSLGELSVVGVGKVDSVPDTAYVDAGVTVDLLPTAEAVETRLTSMNNAILAAVEELGVREEDIKTTNYSISPQYDYSLRGSAGRITGYTGNASLAITVRETDKAPDVVVAVTGAGATNVGGIRFDIDDPKKFQEEARNLAIADAKAQAKKLADQLGIRLGNVTNIVESSTDMPIMYSMEADAKMARGGSAPELAPGSQTVTSTVTLFFERR